MCSSDLDTRAWLANLLDSYRSVSSVTERGGKKRPLVDAW